jgi:hypothetical protein
VSRTLATTLGRRPCIAPYCGGPVQYRGIACEVHWELLSDEARNALNVWLDRRHPRGGGITSIPEGLFATASAGDGIVRHEWRAILRQDILDGLWDEADPATIAKVRRHVGLS